MADPPITRASLLVRLRDVQDQEAWNQFVALYAPLIYSWGRRRGLQDADAADLAQEVLRAVSGAVGRLDYDPQRGAFRDWLFVVTRNKIRNLIAARKCHVQGGGDPRMHSRLEEEPAREEADLWDQEYKQRLFAWAADQVRDGFEPSSWQAFWMTAVEGQSPKQTAQALAMSVGAVYIAKSRILARLREEIRELQEEDVIPPFPR